MNAVSDFKDAFGKCRARPLLFLSAIFLDVMFFITHGFLTTPIRDRLVESATKASLLLGDLLGQQGLVKLLFSPGVQPVTNQIIVLLSILFLQLYLIYVVFHGILWWQALRIMNKKIPFKQYLIGFAKANLVWFVAFVLYKIIDLLLGLRYAIVKVLSESVPEILGGILFAVACVVGIIALFSYPTLKLKKFFKIKLKSSLPLIVFSILLFGAAYFITSLALKWHLAAGIIVSLITLFPLMTLIRVMICKEVLNVRSRN